MRLYFVRHGESEANVLRIISNRGWQHGLTPKGIEQAQTLAETLRDDGIGRVYHSPLRRAAETAQILAEAWSVPSEEAPALREFDCGVWENRGDEEAWNGWLSVWQAWHERAEYDFCADQGESFHNLRARFVPFVEGLIRNYGETDQAFALVGHGGTYMTMLPLVLENISPGFALSHAISNTGYIIGEMRAEKLVCVQWCETTVEAP